MAGEKAWKEPKKEIFIDNMSENQDTITQASINEREIEKFDQEKDQDIPPSIDQNTLGYE